MNFIPIKTVGECLKHFVSRHPRCYIYLAVSFIINSCTSDTRVIKTHTVNKFPSASAIDYVGGRFYIMGDDSKDMLIMDADLDIKERFNLYATNEFRISKKIKADIEALTTIGNKELLLIGSGSLSPYRNGGWIYNYDTKKTVQIQFDTLYKRLKASGLEVLNIEGACSLPGVILLANRGNNSWRNNHLIVAEESFWKAQSTTPFSIISFENHHDETVFKGVSGLDYAKESDLLMVTISTENTSSNTGDGAIGKSYLWIVRNISSKLTSTKISPDIIIDLENVGSQFSNQKIESVCVSGETNRVLKLAFVADNDDGSSTVFKVELKKADFGL